MKNAPSPAEFVDVDAPSEWMTTGLAHDGSMSSRRAPEPAAQPTRPDAPTLVRFATFNIASGRSSVDNRVDLRRLTDAIAALDADVLSLQEVDRNQQRSHGADLTALAAEAAGAEHHVFAPALNGTPGSRWVRPDDRPWDGAAYGCALISRFPLRRVRIVHIPAPPLALPLWIPGPGLVVVREEPRVVIIADVDIAGRPVTVVATHLPVVPGWKGWHLRRLVRTLAARADPLLLLGDLNLRGATPARITGYSALASAPTFPSSRPRFQLDHVLLRGPLSEFGSVKATFTPVLPVSDHRPLVVDVEMSHGPGPAT